MLHHSATTDGTVYRDFDSIKQAHLAKGWRDIGYHWIIERVNDSLVWLPGRQEWDTGAHCIGRNQDGIGICCIGNFQLEVPDDELYQSVAALCRDIKTRHSIQEIGGHRDYNSTLCPGKNFDTGRVRRLAEMSEREEQKVACKIIIKGKTFPGYVKGGTAYFQDAPVREVMNAFNYQVNWNEKDLAAIIE